MDNRLVRYANGEAIPDRQDREIARAAKVQYDKVRMAGLKVQGATALAGHAMERLVELDQHRRGLAGGDETTNRILAEIELETVRQVKRIQQGLNDDWGL